MTDDELLNLIPPKIREGLADEPLVWGSVLFDLAAIARANGNLRMTRESRRVLKHALAIYKEWASSAPPVASAGSYHHNRITYAVLMELWLPSEVTK